MGDAFAGFPDLGEQLECIGGPLCGRKFGIGPNPVLVSVGEDGRRHCYRRIRLETGDGKRVARYYHYFGQDDVAARVRIINLFPPKRMFRKNSRKQ
jgi:hypothetical protein